MSVRSSSYGHCARTLGWFGVAICGHLQRVFYLYAAFWHNKLVAMPVQIGVKAHSFSDPTGLLSDCHRRIEMFLGWLQRVSEVADKPLAQEAKAALESSLRYFREAAPKHTADEEESLFPRLRLNGGAVANAALEMLEPLEAQHRRADSLHAEIDRLGRICLQNGVLSRQDTQHLRENIKELMLIYAEHIRIEDTQVFPAAAKALTEAEKAAIAAEMASRRK